MYFIQLCFYKYILLFDFKLHILNVFLRCNPGISFALNNTINYFPTYESYTIKLVANRFANMLLVWHVSKKTNLEGTFFQITVKTTFLCSEKNSKTRSEKYANAMDRQSGKENK